MRLWVCQPCVKIHGHHGHGSAHEYAYKAYFYNKIQDNTKQLFQEESNKRERVQTSHALKDLKIGSSLKIMVIVSAGPVLLVIF